MKTKTTSASYAGSVAAMRTSCFGTKNKAVKMPPARTGRVAERMLMKEM